MEKRIFLPEFLVIPYKLILDKSITPLDIKVYGIILWFRKTTKQKKCFAKNTTIAQLLSSKDRTIASGTIANSLVRLEKLKYIKRTFQDEEKKIRTEILPLVNEEVSSNNYTYNQIMKGVSSNNYTRVSSNDEHSNNKRSKKYIDKDTPTLSPEKIYEKILKFYYVSISKTSTSEKLVLTRQVKKIISGALKEYSSLDLLLAIKGFSEDEWQVQNNGHRGAEWFFSDSKRLGQYIGLFNKNRNSSFITKAKKFLNN